MVVAPPVKTETAPVTTEVVAPPVKAEATPVKADTTPVKADTTPVISDVAPQLKAETTPAAILPETTGGLSALDTVIQGSNTSTNATAISGDVTASNVATVNVGPTGGQQIGDNTLTLNQNISISSGSAIAGSQVFGSTGFVTSGLFSGLHTSHADFFDADDFFDHDSFFDHDRFFHHRFFRDRFFFSRADLLHLAILTDLAEDCLDRLRFRTSLALLRICEHRLERLADADFFFTPFFFPDVFFSRAGTHALFGFDGFAFSSHGTHALIGPLGASFAGNGSAVSFGLGGFAAAGPFGSSSGGAGALLFAPFGLVLPSFIEDGFFHHRHFGLSSTRHRLFRELLRLRLELALLRARLEVLEHHRHLILGTITFHSLFDDGPWFDGWRWFSPFGHRTVFVADGNVLISNPSFFFDDPFFFRHAFFHHHRFFQPLFFDPVFFVDGDVVDEIEDAIDDLEDAIERLEDALAFFVAVRFVDCFDDFFFFGGCFHHHHAVLDLPGIRLGVGRFFI
jgi:hypothetical protein